MATVNIANNTWQTNSETSTINITAKSTMIYFNMGSRLTDEKAYAKACIEIDISQYKTITLKYSNHSGDGITDLEFGIFNNMTPSSSSGKIAINSNSWKGSGGSITVDVSALSGTKYVGFKFYGNTYTFNDNVGWSATQRVNLTSLTAVERGYTITYNANGGTGTTASQSVLPDNNVTLNANGFTAPPASSPVHTIYLKDENGNPSVNGTATCYENKFYCWGLGSATGTNYQPGASYGPVNSNTVFYAKWSTNYELGSSTKSSIESQGYQVIFDASTNGGNCSITILNSKIYTYYDFNGWVNSGTLYPVGSKVGGPTAYTYYESWTSRTENGSIQLPVATKTNSSSISIAIYLNANGGTCSITSKQSSAKLTYDFDGWYDEDTRVGGANDNFVPNQATTLTARFTTITGSFNEIILPTPYRQGYEFLGWSIDENATSGIIGKYDPSGEETLYAIWKPKGTVRIGINGNMNKKAQAYIFHDGAWHLTQPQTSYNNNWKVNGG